MPSAASAATAPHRPHSGLRRSVVALVAAGLALGAIPGVRAAEPPRTDDNPSQSTTHAALVPLLSGGGDGVRLSRSVPTRTLIQAGMFATAAEDGRPATTTTMAPPQIPQSSRVSGKARVAVGLLAVPCLLATGSIAGWWVFVALRWDREEQ